MPKKLTWIICATFALSPSLSCANTNYTDLGAYAFASHINGDISFGDLTTSVDVDFKTILKNLDIGFMGLLEHKYNRLIFFADIAYLKLSADQSRTLSSVATVTLNAQLQQTLAEGFIGYRLYDRFAQNLAWTTDVFAGLRYNDIDVDLNASVNTIVSAISATPSRGKDWFDWVFAIRQQFLFKSGWGLTGWVDLGKGADSSSYQIAGFINYHFLNNYRVFLGYRIYHFEYDQNASRAFNLNLDYSGPMLGVRYRFA